MTKAELRKVYLERRRSLSPEDHAALSSDIVDRLFNGTDFGSIKAVNCYVSLKHFGEVETSLFFERLWEIFPQMITTAPRVNDSTGEIDSLIYQRDTPTIENKWRIPEPAGFEIVAPESLDLIVVPLLCFDARGHRVGYGKGFYDRFLQKCRPDCIKAGLSFFPPVSSIDVVYESDVPLDLCATPDELFRFH